MNRQDVIVKLILERTFLMILFSINNIVYFTHLSVMIYENFQLFSNFSLKTFGSGVFLYYLCKRFQEEIT